MTKKSSTISHPKDEHKNIKEIFKDQEQNKNRNNWEILEYLKPVEEFVLMLIKKISYTINKRKRRKREKTKERHLI